MNYMRSDSSQENSVTVNNLQESLTKKRGRNHAFLPFPQYSYFSMLLVASNDQRRRNRASYPEFVITLASNAYVDT